MKERNKPFIRGQQTKRIREYAFPQEHLGVGDRLILNLVLDEVAENHRKYTPTGQLYLSTVVLWDINKGMKEFGYKVREIDPNT